MDRGAIEIVGFEYRIGEEEEVEDRPCKFCLLNNNPGVSEIYIYDSKGKLLVSFGLTIRFREYVSDLITDFFQAITEGFENHTQVVLTNQIRWHMPMFEEEPKFEIGLENSDISMKISWGSDEPQKVHIGAWKFSWMALVKGLRVHDTKGFGFPTDRKRNQ